MTTAEIKNRLRELGEVKPTSLTSEQKQEIETLYEQVLDKPFKKTSCRDCYRDACIIAYNYLKKHGCCAEHRQYKMRAGALIQLGFGNSEFLMESNCNDYKARKHLAEHPEDIEHFYKYPENWKEDVLEQPVRKARTRKTKKTTTE